MFLKHSFLIGILIFCTSSWAIPPQNKNNGKEIQEYERSLKRKLTELEKRLLTSGNHTTELETIRLELQSYPVFVNDRVKQLEVKVGDIEEKEREIQGKIEKFEMDHPTLKGLGDLNDYPTFRRMLLSQEAKTQFAQYKKDRDALSKLYVEEESLRAGIDRWNGSVDLVDRSLKKVERTYRSFSDWLKEKSESIPTGEDIAKEIDDFLEKFVEKKEMADLLLQRLDRLELRENMNKIRLDMLKDRVNRKIADSLLGEYIKKREANLLRQMCEQKDYCGGVGIKINDLNRNIENIVEKIDAQIKSGGGNVLPNKK
ncbi:MAG: hypothetical protein OXB88_02035 [Bacteriovoracales bacterium]|nr:hypothetical protein [Bacteriovoracales bacterium]